MVAMIRRCKRRRRASLLGTGGGNVCVVMQVGPFLNYIDKITFIKKQTVLSSLRRPQRRQGRSGLGNDPDLFVRGDHGGVEASIEAALGARSSRTTCGTQDRRDRSRRSEEMPRSLFFQIKNISV